MRRRALPLAAHCSHAAPLPRFSRRLRRSDLSEATLPGSIISLAAMFVMVVLFFLVRRGVARLAAYARTHRARATVAWH